MKYSTLSIYHLSVNDLYLLLKIESFEMITKITNVRL